MELQPERLRGGDVAQFRRDVASQLVVVEG